MSPYDEEEPPNSGNQADQPPPPYVGGGQPHPNHHHTTLHHTSLLTPLHDFCCCHRLCIHEMDPYAQNHHYTTPQLLPPHAKHPHTTTDHRCEDPPPPPPHIELYNRYTAVYYLPPPPPLQPIHLVSHGNWHQYYPHMPHIVNHYHIVSFVGLCLLHLAEAVIVFVLFLLSNTILLPFKKKKKNSDDKPTVRVYTKAKTNYSLTIREGKVILAPSNPSDPHQHWIKDEKFSMSVKDEEGYPSFALVNKATRQAIKHSIDAAYPVQLTNYIPDKLDEFVLWSQGRELGDGYKAVRPVHKIQLNLDAFQGVKEYGGVHEGTDVVLWEWNEGDNQRWAMAPY